MNRREFVAGAATIATAMSTRALAIESIAKGVKIGLITSSLNPLPLVPGKTAAEVVIDQCLRMGVGNVELGSRFFGPAVKDVVAGRAPKIPTPDYLKTRDEQRQWCLSPDSLREFADARARFERAGINLFSTSTTFFDDCTDAEIDAMFRQMQALGIKVFQTNQTRVPMGPRLVPAAEKYGISPAFHPHAAVDDPNEVASPESLAKLLAISPIFRVCLDIGHFVAGNNDPVAYLREHHDKITHIHVKDRKRDGGPNVAWGEGDTPIRECLHLIRDNRWPIIALVEREYKGSGTPYEQTKADFDMMREMLNA
ncbi:MAG TPA: TIM barrel protein [Sphingomonas sp.]|uniref:sugar phosphate isomerase/epimerase family protein n=1 Tax=Sphingomonas sp. TaxID=28214 RepID=UPI002CF017B3|nr:TIM barrel protein [Sphingomonas sp.]HMI19937.1 TIM barrel protein [Sphingomonas sp.]